MSKNRIPYETANLPRPRGVVGGIQNGVSSANIREIIEQRGASSANLAAALQATPAQPANPPAAQPVESKPKL
jgi:hypothetical protein